MDLIKRLKEKEAQRLAAKEQQNEETKAPEDTVARPNSNGADAATPTAKKPATSSILSRLKRPATPPETPDAGVVVEANTAESRSANATVEETPPLTAPVKKGLSLPSGPVRRRVIGAAPAPTPPGITADNAAPPATHETQTETVEEKPSGPKLPGVLGKMQSNALQRAKPAITPAAQEATNVGERYTAEQMLADLQAEDDQEWADEDDPEAAKLRDEARAAILRKGTATITEIFREELADLEMSQASDYALKEMAQIVKLTFLRVKSAPNAYAYMSLEERAPLMRAMRAMAEKRAGATRSRKAAEAKEISAGYEDMLESIGGSDNEALAGLLDGFDIGGV